MTGFGKDMPTSYWAINCVHWP